MKIVVNDIAASSGGAMAILKQFYNYVKEHDTENEWIFLLGDAYLQETDRIKVVCLPAIKASRLKKIWFDCVSGKKIIEKYRPDVVVSLQNIITFGLAVPQVLYVHQSIPFQTIRNFSFLKREERSLAVIQHVIGRFIIASVKRADKVFIQTEWMQKAVAAKTGLPEDAVFRAFPDTESFESDPSRFASNRFFYPTTTAVYRNNGLITKACDLLNREGFTDFCVRLTLPEGSLSHPNVACVGRLDRARMQQEYQSGTLLFPSYIETVGLPMLEARSCGTMVLAGNTPFARECLASYENAAFFDPFDPQALADEMKKVMTGQRLLRPATPYTPDRPSWKDFYQEVISCKRSSC